jgi:hypothetical protein
MRGRQPEPGDTSADSATTNSVGDVLKQMRESGLSKEAQLLIIRFAEAVLDDISSGQCTKDTMLVMLSELKREYLEKISDRSGLMSSTSFAVTLAASGGGSVDSGMCP